jgi:hypothetical protein
MPTLAARCRATDARKDGRIRTGDLVLMERSVAD